MTTEVIVIDDSETIIVDKDVVSVILTQDDTAPEIIVVSEADTLVVSEDKTDTVITYHTETQVITEGSQGPMGPKGDKGDTGASTNISNAPDMDITNLRDGSLPIWSAQAQKWVANTQLTNQSLESGHY